MSPQKFNNKKYIEKENNKWLHKWVWMCVMFAEKEGENQISTLAIFYELCKVLMIEFQMIFP